jgi:hypothetical protein
MTKFIVGVDANGLPIAPPPEPGPQFRMSEAGAPQLVLPDDGMRHVPAHLLEGMCSGCIDVLRALKIHTACAEAFAEAVHKPEPGFFARLRR